MEDKESKKDWNIGGMFWGLLLILIGSLFLLNNLNIVDVNFSNILRSWPLLIVAAGLSLLPIRGWLGNTIVGIAVVAMLGLVILMALNVINPDATAQTETQNVEIERRDKINSLTLSTKTGAGELRISSAPQVAAVVARLDSNFATLDHRTMDKGQTQEIDINTSGSKNWWNNGDLRNNLSLTLTQSLPLNLNVGAGASHVIADLTGVQLRNLAVDSGASDIEFKLGNKTETSDVSFDIGASSIVFKVPKDSGVSLRVDDGLSSKKLPGFKNVSDNYYETENYQNAKKKIRIHGNMGMANLTIERY